MRIAGLAARTTLGFNPTPRIASHGKLAQAATDSSRRDVTSRPGDTGPHTGCSRHRDGERRNWAAPSRWLDGPGPTW